MLKEDTDDDFLNQCKDISDEDKRPAIEFEKGLKDLLKKHNVLFCCEGCYWNGYIFERGNFGNLTLWGNTKYNTHHWCPKCDKPYFLTSNQCKKAAILEIDKYLGKEGLRTPYKRTGKAKMKRAKKKANKNPHNQF